MSTQDNESLGTVIPDERAREILNHLFECASTPRVLAHVLLGRQGREHALAIVGALVTAEAMVSRSILDSPHAAGVAQQLRLLYADLVNEHNKLEERGLDA